MTQFVSIFEVFTSYYSYIFKVWLKLLQDLENFILFIMVKKCQIDEGSTV